MNNIIKKAYERLNCIREAIAHNRKTYTYKKVVYRVLDGERILARLSEYSLIVFLALFFVFYLVEKDLWKLAIYTVIAYLVSTFAVPVLLEIGNKFRK